jgi:hypothetical protein
MTPNAQEKRVWDLLVRTFTWEVPPDSPVRICQTSGELVTSAHVQIFELVVTAILARKQPEFTWCVTPSHGDHGLDFLGVHGFLNNVELGIEAVVKVGGQCKKRSDVKTVLGEIAGSLISMADAVNPTFFVVALSARVTKKRLDEARETFQREMRRDCHILDRTQVEGLMREHLDLVAEILHLGLPGFEEEVMAYLKDGVAEISLPSVVVSPPPGVLGGLPFHIAVDVRWTLASNPAARLWWRPQVATPDPGIVTLIGPNGADGDGGTRLGSIGAADDPFSASCMLEFVTYTVGRVDLGELVVGLGDIHRGTVCRVDLGEVDVRENMRPRFFDRPYRPGLARLAEAYERVLAGVPSSVGVIGAGGSGKSRLCEEFALEKRRRGCTVVTVRHSKTHEAPMRIVADLLTEVAGTELASGEPAEDVLRVVARYDGDLATRTGPAIRSVFGTRTTARVDSAEQHIVSAILLLLVARSRRAPLIVHLQDLHWCSADVLSLLERLVRQLGQLRVGDAAVGRTGSRVLFLFEGRVRESGESGGDAWSSAPFEAFLARTESTPVMCSSFTPEDGLSFTRLLFEDRHNAHRMLADDLLQLQQELVERIWETAGGNPFHTLEQVRLLRELGVVGQNPRTGLLYTIRPAPAGTILPESVFAAIQLRWQYMRSRAPELALLVWGSTLLDDRVGKPLFQRLWRELAPDFSLRDIDATDMLWTDDGTAYEVAFRHENYFESIRRFTVSEADRRRVVDAYCGWFAELRRPSPAERFSWARAMLELPDPDRTSARAILASALKSSERSGDPRLTRRILASYLDLTWEIDDRRPIAATAFLRHCDQERDLCRDLLAIDRDHAATRIARTRDRIDRRLRAITDRVSAKVRDGLLRRLLTADVLHSQLLFNDRRPTEAADIAGDVVAGVRAQRLGAPGEDGWELLEMEALYTLSCAQAIAGESAAAVQSSAAAAEIAVHSQSPLARKVLSTYGTIVLAEDPAKGESLLRSCFEKWPENESSDAALVHVHLCAALVLQAHRLPPRSTKRRTMLLEARDRMTRIHDLCQRLGMYPDAGAAALVRGIVAALLADGDEAVWFAHAVAAAARGRQMETLWRAHIDLAMALYRKEGQVTQRARDHALAALEIMQDTLTPYSEPERSPRFEMLRVGMAGAVRILLAVGDEGGLVVLERYPALRSHFSDPERGVLAPYDGGPRFYQWLAVEDVDYAVY